MKLRSLFFLVGSVACTASSGGGGDLDPQRRPSEIPEAGAPDAGEDAGPCSDCEYFPDTCSADTFCSNGPFDSDDPDTNLDSRVWITTIRGRSPSDVWAAGSLGALAHFDGATWRRSDVGTRESLLSLWLRDDATEIALSSTTNVFARGVDTPDGGVPSSDGFRAYPPSYAPGTPVFSISYTSPAIFAGWAAPGSEWFWFRVGTALFRLHRSTAAGFEIALGIGQYPCYLAGCTHVVSAHGITPDALWAVGHGGQTVRITDAVGPSPAIEAFDSGTKNILNGVWEASTSEAWSVGARGTIRYFSKDSMRWDIVADVPTTVDLRAVWGSSPSDVWAVGDEAVALHFDGMRWSRVKIAGLGRERPSLTAVWVAAPGHVWIGGKGVVLSLGGKP